MQHFSLPRYVYFALIATLFLYASSMIVPANATEEQPATSTQETEGGAGDLLVAPTRVVLEGRARSSDVTLSNKGNKEATFRISFLHLRMGEDGAYKELSEEEAKSTLNIADSLVRYSPRQVTLKPGESQVVKIMLNKPESLADGEYVSHMLFRAVPETATGEDVEAKNVSEGKISVRLTPIYGVSIPIIVRHGELSAQAKLSNPKIEQGKLSLTISRTGNKSVFGDLTVSQSGSIVGQLRGVGVLAYTEKRSVSLAVTPSSGPLTIEYRQREEDGGNVMDKIEVK